MQLKKDNIITLENDDKFIVVNDTLYEDVKYFLLMGVTDDESDVTTDILIVQEVIKGKDVFIKPVRDPEMILLLTKILKPKE